MALCAFFRIFAIRNPKITNNMAKVYVFMADGFEDVEALIPIDVLRRGGVDVTLVSTTEDIIVESAGASNLFEHEGVCQALKLQVAAGKKIAAICASPAIVLAQLGLLDGKKATCYPGFERLLEKADYTGELVTVDGNITTGEGPAAAFPYAYTILADLTDQATADQIAEGMRYKHLMER